MVQPWPNPSAMEGLDSQLQGYRAGHSYGSLVPLPSLLQAAWRAIGGIYVASYTHGVIPSSISPGLCLNTTGVNSLNYPSGYGSAEFAHSAGESGNGCSIANINGSAQGGPDGLKPGISPTYTTAYSLVAEIVATSSWNGNPGSTTVDLGTIGPGMYLSSQTIFPHGASGMTRIVIPTGTCSNAGLSFQNSLSIKQWIGGVNTGWTSRGLSRNPAVSAVGPAGTVATSPDGSGTPTYADMANPSAGQNLAWGWSCSGTNDSGTPVTVGVGVLAIGYQPYPAVSGASIVSGDSAHYITMNGTQVKY